MATTTKKRLGERLVEMGVLSDSQLQEALGVQQGSGEQLGKILIELGHVRDDDVMRALCEAAHIPWLDVDEVKLDPKIMGAIPEQVAMAHTAIPLKYENGRLIVAMANPFDMDATIALEWSSERRVSVVAAPRWWIKSLLEQVYLGELQEPGDLKVVSKKAAAAPDVEEISAAQAVQEIVKRAISLGATDVHIEPMEEILRVRYRMDGLLREGGTYASSIQNAVAIRIKILAGLNIAESKVPQDGRFRMEADGRPVDLRISTFPTLHGEDVVLRVLDRSKMDLRLASLGMTQEDMKLYRQVLRRPHGVVLVTGPTGSGKTTTLYCALNELNTGERSIVTLEDPVEYAMEGIRQSQVNVRRGVTFAAGLRAILRQDPDIILVGEMRDGETVQIGLSAALTGHLVLTTLHTNTAAGTIPRLLDMGAEPFILASALQMVLAQRLLRMLCANCKEPGEIPDDLRERYKLGDAQVFKPRGCAGCRNQGYRGRLGIFEILPMTKEVIQAIYDRCSVDEIRRVSGRPTLLHDGLRKVKAGLTTLDELLRVMSVQ
ncbi:MAG: Flp pilus assembly complex ATPase component TadA [Gemmatimonadetes bacterium]|nr:Flp pilus assembly complex ATPase component TadA [Gemmatimonadota bacterium]